MNGDIAHILEEAKKQGIDLSDNSDELVAQFAFCVSEKLLAGEPLKAAVKHCLLRVRHLI